MKYIDICVNLFSDRFADPEAVIARAAADGILCIADGCDMETNEKLHRFLRRYRLVINIAGYENSLRCFFPDYLCYLLKDVTLIFNHRKIIDTLAYVQICKMYEFHLTSSVLLKWMQMSFRPQFSQSGFLAWHTLRP